MKYYFKDVTLLITHYNRTSSLLNLLTTFSTLDCHFEEIIVSDDGSNSTNISILHQLKSQFNYSLITTPKNKGLGNNNNKGQDAVKTKFTLYVQEDFEPTAEFPVNFYNALRIMETNNSLDMIRFYAYFEYPYLKNPTDGFYEMDFKLWKPGYQKFYVYSDHPHLRRNSFFQKFGRYKEGIKGDNMEYDMMMSFLKNNGKSLFFKNYKDLFLQKNSSEEPSTMHRNIWRESNNFFIVNIRHIYRHLKFNFDYLRY